MKWTFTLPEQLDICVFFFFVVFSLDCSIFLRSLALLFLSLIILRGGGEDSGSRYGQDLGKERRIINGMHQLYHQIPALCAQTIEYLPIYHLYQTYNKDAVSPVDVSKRCPCCCGFVLFSCMYPRERSSEESDRVM